MKAIKWHQEKGSPETLNDESILTMWNKNTAAPAGLIKQLKMLGSTKENLFPTLRTVNTCAELDGHLISCTACSKLGGISS